MSKIDVLLGLQWGDEGKGKIVDVLAPHYDVVARFQGGPNAGHTLVFDNKTYVLHCIPSGIFQEDTINLIGNGMVVDPIMLIDEIDSISAEQIDITKKLLISKKAHMITPTHKLLDAAYEQQKGKQAIGSTLRGIGPTYTDKVARTGIRIGDILEDTFQEKLKRVTEKHIQQLDWMNYPHDDVDTQIEQWLTAVEQLKKFSMIDSEQFLYEQLKAGKKVLAEGAQGTMLDIAYGSYPFVTSSHTITGGVCTGLGVAPKHIGTVYGIFKAYTTRVGGGSLPTELHDDMGRRIQDQGNEVGATTGRERRCGWLDAVLLRYACMVNGVDELFMMKGDVLSGLPSISVATSYERDGARIDIAPYDLEDEKLSPIYEEFDAWQEDISTLRSWSDMPNELISYISYLESCLEAPITLVSVGPDRVQTLKKGE